MASSSPYKFGDLLNTYRYTFYIRGPVRDIMADTVEVILNEEAFKKTAISYTSITHYCSNRTVQEKLEDIGVYQNLNTKEKKIVDDAKNPLKGNDITFLFWIFDKIWKTVYGQSGNLWDLMKRVKDERNAVSHEDMPLTTQEMQVKISDFAKPLMDLLTEALSLYPAHKSILDQLTLVVTDSVAGIKERVREPLDPSRYEDYRKFLEEKKDFAPQATKEIQEESKKELLEGDLFRRSTTVVCEWHTWYSATDTSNISVPLEADTEREFHPFASHINQTVIDQKDILKAKSPSGEEPTVISLSGEAGAGKTTLLSLITEHFVKGHNHGFERLSYYSLLFYTEFRNTKLETLDQYFQEVLANTVSDYGLQNVKKAIYQKQMLFLCDGFDEKNPKSLNLFSEVVNIPSVNLKILVTTRPNCSNELTKLVNKSKRPRINLKILPLTETTVVECIKKVVNHNFKDDHTRRDQKIKEITTLYAHMAPELQNIMRVPLYTSLITTLLLSEPQLLTEVNTMSKLFQVIRINEVKRTLDKCQDTITEAQMNRFVKLFNKKALENHLEQKHEISNNDVDDFKECFQDNQCFHTTIASLCSSKHSLAMLETNTVYCYKHRLNQEFSAACDITDKILDGEFDAFRGIIEHPITTYLDNFVSLKAIHGLQWGMQKIMAFVTGILSDKPDRIKEYAKDIINCLVIEESIKDKSNISPIMEILSEGQNNSYILDALISKFQLEDRWDWEVKDARDLSGLEALMKREEPNSLTLDFNIDPETVDHLIPTLETATSREVDVELNLWKHFTDKCYSDEYLQACRSIKCFQGCLKNFSMIPDTIRYLSLLIEGRQIKSLNDHLPKMKELHFLGLHIGLKDLGDDQCSISKEFRALLMISIGAEGCDGDVNGQMVAAAFNSLWPENRRKERTSPLMSDIRKEKSQESPEQSSIGKEDSIVIAISNIQKNEIQRSIKSLNINNLKSIQIATDIDITEDDKNELQKICLERGFGDLILLR